MVRPEETWETDRLLVRPAACADAQELFDGYACDPEVAKYMIWRPHRDIGETLAFLRRCEAAWTDGSAFPWTLRLKDGGAFVGMLETRIRETSADVGYAVSRRFWRQGLMSEALGTFVAWALRQPEIHRVWATCDMENVASAGVLERVGMQKEGVLRRWLVHPNVSGTPRDSFCYSIVKGA